MRRNPLIFHPFRAIIGLILLFGGLYLAFGLKSTFNYMGSSILIIMSLDTLKLSFENIEFMAGIALFVAGFILIIISSGRQKNEGRILVYRWIFLLGLLLTFFGMYVLFDPSTGTDVLNEKVVEIIYLQLGAVYNLGIRFWVGTGFILLGLILIFRFSFGKGAKQDERRQEVAAPEAQTKAENIEEKIQEPQETYQESAGIKTLEAEAPEAKRSDEAATPEEIEVERMKAEELEAKIAELEKRIEELERRLVKRAVKR